MLPLLRDPSSAWPERTLVTHVGRWPKGKSEENKFAHCSIRNTGFRLVNNKELYDLTSDRGETTNVIEQHPEVVTQLRTAYDQWWKETVPLMVNEDVVPPKYNPYHVWYWKEFGGGPKE